MQHLLRMGVLQGDLEGLIAARVPELFMACGLGHLIGVDTHDVGGYPRGVMRIDEPGIKALRTTRKLKEGMCLTVEPGLQLSARDVRSGIARF